MSGLSLFLMGVNGSDGVQVGKIMISKGKVRSIFAAYLQIEIWED